jgi:hypothetical protein
MCLQLADQSVCYPAGITKNIPVKIWNFFVPIDFVVLDMHEDMKTPLTLGRPFLSTMNAHIDVRAGKIKFHINGKEELFAFKPRPEQCSNLEWCEKQVSRSLCVINPWYHKMVHGLHRLRWPGPWNQGVHHKITDFTRYYNSTK